jgi:hypothetical protein
MGSLLVLPFQLPRLSTSVVIPLTGTCLYLGWRYVRRLLANPNGLPLPPGPPRHIPWIGNASDMPVEYPWLTYDQWTKQYGMLEPLVCYRWVS